MKSEKTVIVVSHDRHFMNKVCTHIADVDFKKITAYSGNYEFWKRSSELAMRLKSDEKRKAEDKAEDLKRFIARFSANASKSRQTTSRQKQLEKLNLDDLPTSSRREPFVGFEIARESGKEVLKIESLSKALDGVVLLNKIHLELKRGDKIALVGASDVSRTTLLKILVGELEADQGSFALGSSIKLGYLPVDNSALFTGEKSLIDWLRQYSPDPDESFLRGWLGRMLFSRDDVFKKTNVLSKALHGNGGLPHAVANCSALVGAKLHLPRFIEDVVRSDRTAASTLAQVDQVTFGIDDVIRGEGSPAAAAFATSFSANLAASSGAIRLVQPGGLLAKPSAITDVLLLVS